MKTPNGRVTADIDGDFVVFLIGMHVNQWHKPRAWFSAAFAMTRMLRELKANPGLGLMHAEGGWFFGGPALVQYWRSYEQLEAYARSSESEHLPAWRAFNKAARKSDAVGIYHETYRVSAGDFEVMYNFMPPVGLLAASKSANLDRSSTSATRMGLRTTDESPVEVPPDR